MAIARISSPRVSCQSSAPILAPHVPQPFEVRCIGAEGAIAGAQDVLNLTRMNWNTADIRGKWPVSLYFARRVGGILDEYGDGDLKETSFRYFV